MGMNDTTKRYLVSSLTTFLATFLTTIGAQISMAGQVEFTFAFWAGVAIVAVRVATKAVVEAIPTLGSADKKA